MNCSFCKQKCLLKDDDCYDGGAEWTCNNHPHVVKELISHTYHVTGDCYNKDCCPQKHHTATIIMFDKYKAKFRHDAIPTFALYADDKGDPILRLSFHPDLTPENIKEKLHLWITFS